MSIPFEPKYTRFPFIVLGYDQKDKRVPRELIINYDTKELFVVSPDGRDLIPLNNIELLNHLTDYNNPHKVTKEQVGLGNVPNIEQASRLEFLDHVTDFHNPHRVTKEQIGLGNVVNTLPAPLFDLLLLRKKYESLTKLYNELAENIRSIPRYKLNFKIKPSDNPFIVCRTFYNNQWNYGIDHMLPDGEYYFEAYVDKDKSLEIMNTVDIIVYPKEAQVEMYYNGQWNGGTRHKVPEGFYAIRATLLGYGDFIDKFEVRQNMQPITIRLTEMEQNVLFAVNPIDATVEVRYNGKWNIGTRHKLPVGEYIYKVYSKGYKTVDGVFKVEDEDVIVPVDLSKNTFPITFQCVGHPDAEIYVYDPDRREWIQSEDNTFELKDGHKYRYKAIKKGFGKRQRWYTPHGSPDLVLINMEVQKYNVTIISDPAGADLQLLTDTSTILGYNGVIMAEVIEGKEYKIYASLPGYKTIEWRPIEFEESGNVHIKLEEVGYYINFNNIKPQYIKYELIETDGTLLPNPIEVNSGRMYYAGTYKFKFSATGYKDQYKEITINHTNESSIYYDIKLEQLYELDIIIKDKDTNLPISEYGITLKSTSNPELVYTNITTGYIEEGEYTIVVTKDKYNRYEQNMVFSILNQNTITILLDKVKYNIKVVTEPEDATIVITGTTLTEAVRDKTCRLPIGNYSIYIEKPKYGELTSVFSVVDEDRTLQYTLDYQGVRVNLSTSKFIKDLKWIITYPDDTINNIPQFRTKLKGLYKVKVEDPSDEYKMKDKEVTFTVGEDDVNVTIEMVSHNKFNVTLRTTPSAADKYIDGKLGGYRRLPVGKYVAAATYDGYEAKQIEFDVANKDVHLSIDLMVRGILTRFTSNPFNTIIHVVKLSDNSIIPIFNNLAYLSNGEFKLVGKHPDYTDKEVKFSVNDDTQTIHIDMTKEIPTPPPIQPPTPQTGNVVLEGLPDEAIINTVKI